MIDIAMHATVRASFCLARLKLKPRNPSPPPEPVSAATQALRHIHGALLDITVPRVAIAKAAELAVEHAAMKEQSNG